MRLLIAGDRICGTATDDYTGPMEHCDCPAWVDASRLDTYRVEGGVVCPPTLADAKAAKLAAIHAEKNRARDGGFIVDGVLFDSDLPARTSYAELAIAMQTDPTLTTRWKASDGVWVDMTSALFQQVYAAGRAHIEACFAWQEAKEQAVAMATTVAAVEAISATYGVTP